jgi:hypothetical protein
VKDPLTVDLSEELEKKSFSLDINNSLFIPLTTSGDNSSDKKIITNLSNLIIESKISNNRDVLTYIPDIENTYLYSDDESSKADKLTVSKNAFLRY